MNSFPLLRLTKKKSKACTLLCLVTKKNTKDFLTCFGVPWKINYYWSKMTK